MIPANDANYDMKSIAMRYSLQLFIPIATILAGYRLLPLPTLLVIGYLAGTIGTYVSMLQAFAAYEARTNGQSTGKNRGTKPHFQIRKSKSHRA